MNVAVQQACQSEVRSRSPHVTAAACCPNSETRDLELGQLANVAGVQMEQRYIVRLQSGAQ